MKKIIYYIQLVSFLLLIRCSSESSDFKNLNNLIISPSATYGNSKNMLPGIESISANDSFFVAISTKTSEIFLFDRELSLLSSFGVKGKGPQELLSPVCILIDDRNNIYALDNGKNAMLHFMKNGQFVSEDKLNSRCYQGKLCLANKSFYYHSMDSCPIINVNINGEFINAFGSFFPSENQSKKFYNNSKIDILPYEHGLISINCQHAEICFYDFKGKLIKTYTFNGLEDFFTELRSIYANSPLSKSKRFAILNILDSSIDGDRLFLLLSRIPEKPKEVVMNTIVVINLQNQKMEYLIRLPDDIYQAFSIKNKKCIAYSFDKSELQLFNIPSQVYE